MGFKIQGDRRKSWPTLPGNRILLAVGLSPYSCDQFSQRWPAACKKKKSCLEESWAWGVKAIHNCVGSSQAWAGWEHLLCSHVDWRGKVSPRSHSHPGSGRAGALSSLSSGYWKQGRPSLGYGDGHVQQCQQQFSPTTCVRGWVSTPGKSAASLMLKLY